MRKSNRKFRLKRQDGIYTVVSPTAASQDYTPEQAWEIVEPIRVALQSLLDGAAADKEYQRVASALNMAAIRTEQIAGNDAALLRLLVNCSKSFTEQLFKLIDFWDAHFLTIVSWSSNITFSSSLSAWS